MPELPDLQVFSKNLHKAFAGKLVKKVTVVNKSRLNVPPETLEKSIENQSVKSIHRVGKELHVEFQNGNVLGLHLMLNGELHFFREANERRNTIIELIFEGGEGLALSDYQGMAVPALNPESDKGPDALSKQVDVTFLKEQLQKKRTSIKKFLLDQHVIRGIGNAYADEILWNAGISPLSVCNKIPEQKIKVLVQSIKTVLTDAEKQIRKTHPDIISGEVRDFLKIHNAKRKHSPGGAVIRAEMQNGRKTYFTDEQELF
ncbi:MAG: DNA-formamidopyrimidine glycosylase family protein [Chitinophagaceae bacterium]